MSNIMVHNNRSMFASEYYYGVTDPKYWDDMLYKNAIIDRRDKAFALYIKLTEHQLLPEPKVLSFEDEKRAHKVEQAYKDCKQLCDERGLII